MAKSRNRQATRSKSGGGFLLGVFIGLVIGLGIAIGVAFYINKTPLPFTSRGQAPLAGAQDGKTPTIAGLPQDGAQSASGADKPKFDFYKILPLGEEPVTDQELKARLRGGAKSQPGGAKELYYIQAGSFQNPAEADNRKAKLAILGIESSVQPTTLPDKGTWYRVRVGPYTKIDEINRVRQTLAQNGISGSLVKLKDSSTTKAN